MKSYNYIYSENSYPESRHEPYKVVQLPHWICINIDEDDNNKYVIITSRIHIKKNNKLQHCYSKDWTDQAIIKDISGVVSHNYGV